MSNKFRAPDRDTVYLLPPSIDDWLPEPHLARLVIDVVEELDLRRLEQEYAGCGSKPYHPGMLLGLLFYGYANGIFSSRKLEAATYELVPMRFICGNLHPDHDTNAAFRRRFLPKLEPLFEQILTTASEMNLLKVGKVSIDGSKVTANASKHKALGWAGAKRHEKQFAEGGAASARTGEKADREEEPEELDIPAELAVREERKKRIRAAMAEINARAEERYAKESPNTTPSLPSARSELRKRGDTEQAESRRRRRRVRVTRSGKHDR